MPESAKESRAFDALLLSLPARHSTIRMRLWRALKATGCGVLRDGVYILPQGATRSAVFEAIESEVKAAGGFAMMLELKLKDAGQLVHIRKLFDRGAEYRTFVDQVNRTRTNLKRLGQRKAQTATQRLRRSLEELVAIDFYPGEAQVQATDALASLEREARELLAEGEPRTSGARVRRLDRRKYQGRTWATRKAPWVDRLASAWLITRFIDRRPKFVWIDRPRDCPKTAIGFDFDGAPFTHTGGRVTYEVLVSSFGLTDDPALVSIGAAVHFLDIGGIPVADAKGLETLLSGVRESARSDDGMAREAAKIFDLFYRAYTARSRERDS